MDTKECSKCGEVKSVEQFLRARGGKYGRRGECKPCFYVYRRNHYGQNSEKYKRLQKEYYQSNTAAHSENRSRWKKENAGLEASYRARRRSAQLQRTPQWADMSAIAEFYLEARRLTELTGIPFHVDHIIPLQGELVSGLHVENNLQLLPAHENLSKSNNYDPVAIAA